MNLKRLILPAIAILAFALSPFYKNLSEKYIDNTLKDAIVTYATLRSVNAGVSVIKNSSVSVGVGVDGTIAIGEVLDPIDDAVERFSDMITLSLWVLGSEKILFELSQMQIIYIFLLFLIIGAIFSKNEIFTKLLIILIFLRLFIPFSALISDYTDKEIFKPQIEKNLKVLSYTQNKTVDINFLDKKDDSWWGTVKNRVSGISDSVSNLKTSMQFYMKNASKIVNALINLSMLYFSKFLLNLILLPLAFFYIIKNIEIK